MLHQRSGLGCQMRRGLCQVRWGLGKVRLLTPAQRRVFVADSYQELEFLSRYHTFLALMVVSPGS
jgi:hypothetical protein